MAWRVKRQIKTQWGWLTTFVSEDYSKQEAQRFRNHMLRQLREGYYDFPTRISSVYRIRHKWERGFLGRHPGSPKNDERWTGQEN